MASVINHHHASTTAATVGGGGAGNAPAVTTYKRWEEKAIVAISKDIKEEGGFTSERIADVLKRCSKIPKDSSSPERLPLSLFVTPTSWKPVIENIIPTPFLEFTTPRTTKLDPLY